MEVAKEEKCEFLPFCAPQKVLKNHTRVTGMEFFRTEQTDNGDWIEDADQAIKIKCDFIISAFGSGLTDDNIKRAMDPIKINKWNLPEIDSKTMQTSENWVYAGTTHFYVHVN